MESYRIAVMGDKNSVLGFMALGLSVFPVETADEARAALRHIAREDYYAVIYMTETLAAALKSDIARYKDELTPAVILIPGKEGSLGIGMSDIRMAMERAVGADIL